MAQISEWLVEELRPHCRLVRASISPGRLDRGIGYHATKIARVFRALSVVIAQSKAPQRVLYMPVDAGLGMYYTMLIAGLARICGYSLILHHHSFVYIDSRVRCAHFLTRISGPATRHILLCECMKRAFLQAYAAVSEDQVIVLSNGNYLEPLGTVPVDGDGKLRLGHLSNLGPEKGLDEVLETARRLIALGHGVRLVLAGPALIEDDARKIERAKVELGDALDYRGSVYGEDKHRFYREIDVFLFPTKYQNEAQPTVLFEAMACGVPSISYARGCIADDLRGGGGTAVPVEDDFVDAAVPILADLARDRARLAEARRRALERAHAHKFTAGAQFEKVIGLLSGSSMGRRTDTAVPSVGGLR